MPRFARFEKCTKLCLDGEIFPVASSGIPPDITSGIVPGFPFGGPSGIHFVISPIFLQDSSGNSVCHSFRRSLWIFFRFYSGLSPGIASGIPAKIDPSGSGVLINLSSEINQELFLGF